MSRPLDCPSLERWQTLFGDTVCPAEREPYERHLETCQVCQERLDWVEELGGALRGLAREVGDPTTAPADPTVEQCLERLHEIKPAEPISHPEPVDLYFLRPADRPGLLGMLGEYEVQEVIGQGGMGVVLKAFDPALKRLAAIKVMAAAVAGSAVARRRFTREAQAAAAVCHENVVTVHGVHEVAGLPYLVMQYVPGESVQDRLDHVGPLAVEEIVRIGMQTASGLAAAHAQGLIHRDIKPANLLLEGEPGASLARSASEGLRSKDAPGSPRVKITDFGLARMVDDVRLTQAGVLAGTPEYMAPEQTRGESIDHRADLFSLGSVLYALCTGRPPFQGETPLAVLLRVANDTPTPLRELNPDVPTWLETLIARLLAKDPAGRFQSAAEVAELLAGYLAHLHQPTVPAPELPAPPAGDAPAPGRGRLGVWVVLLLVVLGLSGVALFLGTLPGEQPLPSVFQQDFRGGRRPEPPLALTGPDADTLTRPEDGGFRITLPAQRKEKGAVGLELNSPLDGDFEITVGYEILKVDRPRVGEFGAGFELWLMTATATKESLGCYRLLRVPDGDVFASTRTTTVDGKRHGQQHFDKASSMAGQLRLTRQGNKATCWASEKTGGPFRELRGGTFDLGPEPLKMVRLAALAGPGITLDLRILDLQVRASSPFAGQSQDPTAPRKRGGKGWLAAVVLVGLAIAGGFLGCLWLAVRQRRAAKNAPTPLTSDKLPAAEKPGWPVSISCSGCGKALKSKPELAGKKIKCPRCGQVLVVPTRSDSRRT